MPAEDNTIRPFQVGFPEAELTELRRRVNATRWPERETVTDDSQGVPLAMMQELARYWGTDYDWRKCEANLNALSHFMTQIDALDIHFIHVRSQHADAFHLVIPSLPGYGFSGKPTTPGWDPARIARAWVVLMKRLGYTQFVAQGGD